MIISGRSGEDVGQGWGDVGEFAYRLAHPPPAPAGAAAACSASGVGSGPETCRWLIPASPGAGRRRGRHAVGQQHRRRPVAGSSARPSGGGSTDLAARSVIPCPRSATRSPTSSPGSRRVPRACSTVTAPLNETIAGVRPRPYDLPSPAARTTLAAATRAMATASPDMEPLWSMSRHTRAAARLP